jgi:hypothetical protein
MKLQANEEKALDDASLLIRYAAESPRTLPENTVTAIALAWKAREDNAWSPEISSKFWTAYSTLCELLKPATVETISASKKIKSRRWIFFGDFVDLTLAQKTARSYRILLFFLLATALIFGFLTTATTKMNEDIKDAIARGDAAATEAAVAITIIKSDLDRMTPQVESLRLSLDDSRIGPDTKSKITTLREKLQDMYHAMDVMNQRVKDIGTILRFFVAEGRTIPGYEKGGNLSRLPTLEDGYSNIRDYYLTRRAVSASSMSEQSVFIINSLYAALVPLLFGAIGACTFVLRLISEQIRETSFSATSPVRHSVRVFLGALAGFAVGLGGIAASAGTGVGLTAAALAFLSGYAVEPVFATMDGIAEKFRRA